MTNDATDKYAEKIAELVQQAYNDGYQAGLQEGGREMQQRILAAASSQPLASVKGDSSDATSPPSVIRAPSSDRAPRGLVGEVVQAVLVNEPGLTIKDIEERAVSLDGRVAPRSITNELHRKKGVKYKQEGRYWSLLTADSSGAADDNKAPDDVLNFDEGGNNAAA